MHFRTLQEITRTLIQAPNSNYRPDVPHLIVFFASQTYIHKTYDVHLSHCFRPADRADAIDAVSALSDIGVNTIAVTTNSTADVQAIVNGPNCVMTMNSQTDVNSVVDWISAKICS